MRFKWCVIPIIAFLTLTLALFPSVNGASGQWVKYGANPVLLPTTGSWDADYVTTPRVLYDGTTYRMWYQGGFSGISSIGYATSSNGIDWTKHGVVLSPGQAGDWDSSSIGLGSVLWNGTAYLMWYTGTNGVTFPGGAIGFAVSSNGTNWVKYQDNPVITPSELGNDQKYIAAPYTIRLNLTYNMWYTGKSSAQTNTNRIIYATSFDGIHWTKWPSPVLAPPSDPSAWDYNGVYSPSVIWNGRIFGGWYSGINQTGVVPRIGFASSLDGAAWNPSPSNPILVPGPRGSWDSAGVEQPSVVEQGNNYMMYYDGYSSQQGQRIGLALNPEGFAIAEFPMPAVQLLLGLAICSTAYIVLHRRTKRHS